MLQCILDVSAILALLLREPGQEKVTEVLSSGAGVCTVNLSEVAARCVRASMPNATLRSMIGLLPVSWVEPDVELAYRAGEMIAVTKAFGLSLGDRFCLALAAREGLPAVTADKDWMSVANALNVQVTLIR